MVEQPKDKMTTSILSQLKLRCIQAEETATKLVEILTPDWLSEEHLNICLRKLGEIAKEILRITEDQLSPSQKEQLSKTMQMIELWIVRSAEISNSPSKRKDLLIASNCLIDVLNEIILEQQLRL